MNRHFARVCAAAACLVAGIPAVYGQEAPSNTRVAIINIQDSITRTQEGQGLLTKLQEKYRPKSEELDKMRQGIETLRAQLNKGANTMSEDARRTMARDIQTKERDLQRASEDAQAEVNREQQEVFNSVGSKLMTVIDKFAKDNGYAIVLDISSPQTPVLYAINEVNITSQVIELYDKQYPQQAAASAAAGSAVAKPPQ
jgi:outer membrane protein